MSEFSQRAAPSGFWQRRVQQPLLEQLRQGISAEKVALTLALSFTLSIFPILGSTTLLCRLAAWLLKLNQPAMHLVNYAGYPVQLASLIPFYRAGETLFRQPHVPLSIPLFLERIRLGFGSFLREFGMIALEGIAVWCLLARSFSPRFISASARPCAGWRLSFHPVLNLLLLAAGLMAVFFAVVWGICVRIRNYGLLDVAWSYGVLILAPIYALQGPGDFTRKTLVTSLGASWSVLLGSYILYRVLRHHPQEDKRYESLRRRWPGPGKFLLFFELQALVVVIFSLPFLFASFNPEPQLHLVEWLGAALVAFAIAGERLADVQMHRFKADPAHRDEVCQSGLWRYSRHPNYFFESLVWWGFFLFALGSPWGWVTILCPLLMLYFLLRVTGIPLTEEYSLKSKGDKYRDYQRTTSAFIPWFRRP